MNTLIAIIGLGVLCLLFEILTLENYSSNCNWIIGRSWLDISEFNSTESFYNNMIVVSKFSSAFQHFYYPNYILVTLSHKFYENHQQDF
jgi:NADH-quinone oxidoreductase subunit N